MLTDPELDQILDDLQALPWTRHLETRSAQLIRERLGYSDADALSAYRPPR